MSGSEAEPARRSRPLPVMTSPRERWDAPEALEAVQPVHRRVDARLHDAGKEGRDLCGAAEDGGALADLAGQVPRAHDVVLFETRRGGGEERASVE